MNTMNETMNKRAGNKWTINEILQLQREYELLEWTIQQIAEKHDSNPSKKMLITGGGAYNTFLIERLKEYTKTELIIPEESIINYKEALIFGLLGFLKDEEKNNCLKSVTGASKDHSSGIIYNA